MNLQVIDWGVTRRGYLPSSQPADGYDVPTRVADDIAVLDSLKIDRVVLVGHSIAGSESSALAVSHPDRVDKVVYLDADALDLSQRNEVPGPPAFFGFFTEADTKSIWTYAAANARYQGVRKPEPAICPCVQFDNAEHPVGSNAGCSSGRAISAGVAAVPLVNWSRHCGTETGRSSRCQCWKSGRHGLLISTRLIRRYSMNSMLASKHRTLCSKASYLCPPAGEVAPSAAASALGQLA